MENPSVEVWIFHGRHGFKGCMNFSCSDEPAMLAKAQSQAVKQIRQKKIRFKTSTFNQTSKEDSAHSAV